MGPLNAIWACFVSVQFGALLICGAIMVQENGLVGVLEGLFVWMTFAQMFILPVSLAALFVLIPLRFGLGLMFRRPKRVAILTGGIIGLFLSLAYSLNSKGGFAADWIFFSVLLAGPTAGWVWVAIEHPQPREVLE